jgi:tRNA U38,U39,U40 pseudouridine synthase TruA
MVGTLMEVGCGQREPESVAALFGKKREDAGFLVPASGLCLMEVEY